MKAPLTEEQKRLVVEYAWKADRMAKARRNPFVDIDDRRQHAHLGLMDAARTFDPSLGVKFSTHAHRRIRGAIRDGEREGRLLGGVRGRLKAARKSGVEPARVHLVGAIGSRAGRRGGPDEPDYDAMLVAPEGRGVVDDRDQIEAAMRALSPRERLIVETRFLRPGGSPKRAAEAVGLSESRIHQMMPELLERLRNHPAFSTQEPTRKGKTMSAAIQCGREVGPGLVRLTADDIGEAIDGPAADARPVESKPAPTPRERSVLDAARGLYGASGVARPREIGTAMGLTPVAVSQAITALRGKGLWPYASPYSAAPGPKPRPKAEPDLSRVDAPPAKPDAREPATPRPLPTGSPGPIFDVLRAFDSLPPDVQAPLVAYLSTRIARG